MFIDIFIIESKHVLIHSGIINLISFYEVAEKIFFLSPFLSPSLETWLKWICGRFLWFKRLQFEIKSFIELLKVESNLMECNIVYLIDLIFNFETNCKNFTFTTISCRFFWFSKLSYYRCFNFRDEKWSLMAFSSLVASCSFDAADSSKRSATATFKSLTIKE